jgi:hypothetical protein
MIFLDKVKLEGGKNVAGFQLYRTSKFIGNDFFAGFPV